MTGKPRVKVKFLYECGRCNNRQVREFEAKDGLLEIPNMYCGCCTRSNNTTVMTRTVSDISVSTLEKDKETVGVRGRRAEHMVIADPGSRLPPKVESKESVVPVVSEDEPDAEPDDEAEAKEENNTEGDEDV